MNSMVIKAKLAATLGALCALAAQNALALQPANLRLGPLYITPTLDLRTFYTDNLWLTDKQKKQTWAAVVTPRVQAWLQNGPNDYSLQLEVKDSSYASSHDDDYTDYTATLDVHQEFTARNTLNLFGQYYDGHEDRGAGFIEGDLSLLTDKPVEYVRSTAGGDYTYGNTESRGRVRLDTRADNFDYQNFRNFTRYFDRLEAQFGATFFWKIAPRTDALLQVRTIANDYERKNPSDPAGSLTSDEMNYLVGVAWEATARTSGHIKVGWYDRDYDSAARQDKDGFLWEVGVTYQPRSYSEVSLKSRRYYQETNGLGNGINTLEASVAWDHDWNSRSSTGLRLNYANDDYEGSVRKDNTYTAEARYDYAFRRWIDLGVGYRYEYRDSDIPSFDYTGNTFFLEARLSL